MITRVKKFNSPNLNMKKNILGPTYFEGLTVNLENSREIEDFEWKKKLVSDSGTTVFKIRFYGFLRDGFITRTDFSSQKVLAVDQSTGQEILLFDGCKHGYNAMFCDTYTKEQIDNRPTNQIYKIPDGSEDFEVILSAYYQIDYDNEFSEEVDANGMIELINGSMEKYDNIIRDGFDVFQILLLDKSGNIYEALSEELA